MILELAEVAIAKEKIFLKQSCNECCIECATKLVMVTTTFAGTRVCSTGASFLGIMNNCWHGFYSLMCVNLQTIEEFKPKFLSVLHKGKISELFQDLTELMLNIHNDKKEAKDLIKASQYWW